MCVPHVQRFPYVCFLSFRSMTATFSKLCFTWFLSGQWTYNRGLFFLLKHACILLYFPITIKTINVNHSVSDTGDKTNNICSKLRRARYLPLYLIFLFVLRNTNICVLFLLKHRSSALHKVILFYFCQHFHAQTWERRPWGFFSLFFFPKPFLQLKTRPSEYSV